MYLEDMEQDHLRGFLRGAIPSFLTYDCAALLPLEYSNTESIPDTTPALGVLMANALLKSIPNQQGSSGEFGVNKLFHPWVMADERNAYRLVSLTSLYTRAILDISAVTREEAVLTACEAAYTVLCGHWLSRSPLLFVIRPIDLAEFLYRWQRAVKIHEQTHSILAHHGVWRSGRALTCVPTITPALLNGCGYDCDRMTDLGLLGYMINSADVPILFGDHPVLQERDTLFGVDYHPIPPALETYADQVKYVNLRRFGSAGQQRLVDVAAKKHYPNFSLPASTINSNYLQCDITIMPQHSSHRFVKN